MSTATVERQMEILEQIHALKRELQELAGDALVVMIAPAATNGASPGAPGDSRPPAARDVAASAPGGGIRASREVVQKIRSVLTRDWLPVREIEAAAGVSKAAMRRALNQLIADGQAEHNGKTRRGSAYRLTEPSPLPGGASSNGHRLSPRVEKSIERAALDAAGEPEPTNELHDRIVESLRFDAGTLTELAMRLDVSRRDIARGIEVLLSDARIVECGLRFPARHKVYGVAE